MPSASGPDQDFRAKGLKLTCLTRRAQRSRRGGMVPGRNRQNAGGFSLIELMIAVAIIGGLATVAIPAYRTYVANAQETMVQNQYRDAIRYVRSKAAQIHAFPATAHADLLPPDSQGWVDELNPRGARAAGGGPAYVPGPGNSATGAIGIEATGSFAGGSAVLRVHRPEFGSIDAETVEIAISAW